MIGSGALVRSLLEAGEVDRLNLFLYPVTFGSGKRLFADGTGVPGCASGRPASALACWSYWLAWQASIV